MRSRQYTTKQADKGENLSRNGNLSAAMSHERHTSVDLHGTLDLAHAIRGAGAVAVIVPACLEVFEPLRLLAALVLDACVP